MSKHYYNCRPYKNAVPCCEFIEHAPTDAQMEALQLAKVAAQKDARKNGQYGWGKVQVKDRSGCFAEVQWSPGSCSSSIWYHNPASSGGMCHVKMWQGVPEWETGPQHQHGAQTAMSPFKRIPGGRVDIHAPEQQVHHAYRDTHVFVHDRVHVHQGETQYIDQSRPEHVQIGMDPTQVHVQQNDRVHVEHHEPKQSAIGAILFGVRKPKQQAIPEPSPQHARNMPALPPPQTIDKGFLLPAPQQPRQAPAPLAIAHQPEMPIPAQRKKSWSIL